MSSIKLKHSGGNGISIAAPSSNPAADRTITLNDNYAGDGSFVTANSSGNVGIGNTDPTSSFSNADDLVIGNGSGHRGMTILAGTSSISGIEFSDGTGSDAAKTAGGIRYDHSGNYMRFNTNDGSERMRVTSGGTFCVSVDGGTNIATQGAADTHDGFMAGQDGTIQMCRTSATTCYINRNGSGGNIVDFRYGGSSVGNISNSGNSLPSDRNYKKNITNLSLGLDLVNKLQPVSYQYKFSNDSDPLMYGLVAQDFETALNDVGVAQNTAAILQYEAKNDEKESDYNLDYTKLTPILINAVKELSAKIEVLEAKVAALEAG